MDEQEAHKYRVKQYRKITKEKKMHQRIRQFISDGGTFIYFCIVFTIGTCPSVLCSISLSRALTNVFSVAFTGRGDLKELYLFGKSVESAVITPDYLQIVNQADVWNYLRGDLYDVAYNRQWYNGDMFSPHDFGNIMLFNKFVGNIRLR